MISANKIIIGAARFGDSYGNLNNKKKINTENIKEIFELAEKYNLKFYDTAPDYGVSEALIGDFSNNNIRVITKVPKVNSNSTHLIDVFRLSIKNSLSRLNTRKLYGLLFRSPIYLAKEPYYSIWSEANKLKNENVVKKIGITIYEPKELEFVYEKLKPDIVQFPYNLFKKIFKNSGWIDKLYDNNVELHARSIFLQGLLLMKKKNFPNKFSAFKLDWYDYHNWLKQNKMSALEACVNFVLSNKKITKMIIGVDNAKQLNEILNVEEKKNIIFSTWKKDIDEKVYNILKW